MWCPEHKRFLHERRERQWLRSKAKHDCIDYSDGERAAFKVYFDSLAGWKDEMSFDKLEDMMISLGLAESKKEVCEIVEALASGTRDVNFFDGLDFEEFLEIVRKCTRADILPVFKAMMEGNLGNPNLNFETVLSQYRRKLFLTYLTERDKKDEKKGAEKRSGSKGSSRKGSPKAKGTNSSSSIKDPMKKGEQVLKSFAALQKSRYDEAEENGEQNHSLLPFEAGGVIPVGGLGMVWRTMVTEQGLASSRPSSAQAKKHREPPLSPRSVVQSCMKVKLPTRRRGRTIIVRESEVANERRHSGSKSTLA